MSKLKLPVILTDPDITIPVAVLPFKASIMSRTCSALITLPLCIPDVLIVAIYCDFYLPRIIP